MPPITLVISAFALACWLVIASVLVRLERRRRQPAGSRSKPTPYSQLRAGLIRQLGSNPKVQRSPPPRPADLDTRLPISYRRAFESLFPPTDDTWRSYFEVFNKVVDSIRTELRAIDAENDWHELLSPTRRVVILLHELELEVNNGGFDQYYLNAAGDGAIRAPLALRTAGRDDIASLVERANAQFPGGPSTVRVTRLGQMDKLPESARSLWSDLDRHFYNLDVPYGGLAAGVGGELIREHANEFFKV